MKKQSSSRAATKSSDAVSQKEPLQNNAITADTSNNVPAENIQNTVNEHPPIKKDPQNYQEYNGNSNHNSNRNQMPANIPVEGYLQILQDYGILRQRNLNYQSTLGEMPVDVYVSPSQIKKLGMRKGDLITGLARAPKEGERYLSLLKVDKIMNLDPSMAHKRPHFANLTPIFPNTKLNLETGKEVVSTRLIDLVAPIGYGQRGLVVAPPKAGKTWLLQEIALGISTNYPDVVLMVVLIGERPEEVTHMAREVKGEVIASNFDEKAETQTMVAELALERAKRRAELGEDVVILLDSITRLARAYNLVVPPSGRTLSGGLDPVSLYPPKHFFGAARNFEEGGSLTILGTALVDTGSKMDDVIYEEFKGTGNMELHLDRALTERRIYPAIDIKRSGTRHEELLFSGEDLKRIFTFRRMLDLLGDDEATELVIDKIKKTKSNKDFLSTLGG